MVGCLDPNLSRGIRIKGHISQDCRRYDSDLDGGGPSVASARSLEAPWMVGDPGGHHGCLLNRQ